MDPHYYITKWEDIVEEWMPNHYIDYLQTEMTTLLYIGLGKGYSKCELLIEYLPFIDEDGNEIIYPSERLISHRVGPKMYLLKDSILKTLLDDGNATIEPEREESQENWVVQLPFRSTGNPSIGLNPLLTAETYLRNTNQLTEIVPGIGGWFVGLMARLKK